MSELQQYMLVFIVALALILALGVFWFSRRLKDYTPGEDDCDHIYFPVVVSGHAIGQECSICHKFNTTEEVYRALNAKERDNVHQ